MPGPKRYDFSVPIRVAWGDMDALRHVNNVAYTRYFETARAEFFVYLHEKFGYERSANTLFILTRLEFQYRGQVYFPATLDVTVGPVEHASRSLVLGCSMWNAAGVCVGDGLSHHMWVDATTGRAMRMPPEFGEILAKLAPA